jgi:ADYC domain
MKELHRSLAVLVCLLFTAPALSAGPAASKPQGPRTGRAAAPVPEAERYARRCQNHTPSRNHGPQGTLLWGTRRAWNFTQQGDERRSVLVSVDLDAPLLTADGVKSLRLENGHLEASPHAATSLVGTVLQGTSSRGTPVEVALCGAEPAPEDPDLLWYRIEAWNPVAQEWENPCVANGAVSDPRAMAVGGVWDASGAHHDVPGKLTLACENGVIAKCIRWGYKPWASQEGQPLAELHQACTRMARADYCGNGQSHTHDGTIIDFYDRLGLLPPTKEASVDWDPARASFEAAWAPDGAMCLARTRDGRALETILKECPERFHVGAPVELGQEDRCTVQRVDMSAKAVLLHNRSYEARSGGTAQAGSR